MQVGEPCLAVSPYSEEGDDANAVGWAKQAKEKKGEAKGLAGFGGFAFFIFFFAVFFVKKD